MADEKPAAGGELIGEPAPETVLGFRVEIDHHVAAEDDVELAMHRPGVQEVQDPEPHAFPERVPHAPACVAGAWIFLEKPGPLCLREPGQHRPRILPGAGVVDHVGVDVAAQHADVAAKRHSRLDHRHDDRVGFLSVGATRRPDPDPSALVRALDERRKDLLRKVSK
ncbi:MAG: hypothetical protein R3D59_17025 [Paracoccaceae bacterium]